MYNGITGGRMGLGEELAALFALSGIGAMLAALTFVFLFLAGVGHHENEAHCRNEGSGVYEERVGYDVCDAYDYGYEADNEADYTAYAAD